MIFLKRKKLLINSIKNLIKIKHIEELAQIKSEKLVDSTSRLIGAGYDCGYTVKDDGTLLSYGNDMGTYGWNNIVSIAVGNNHILGLKCDGSVVAAGNNKYGQCNVSEWNDISKIYAQGYNSIGIKRDGRVFVIGDDDNNQLEAEKWTGIIDWAIGNGFIIGLKGDGKVISTGENDERQCEVQDWYDIVAISAGLKHTVGIKKDGSVVATGCNDENQCEVYNWNNIIAISAGNNHTLGLQVDGQVVACGDDAFGQCEVKNWNNIIAISAGNYISIGLRKDGTFISSKSFEIDNNMFCSDEKVSQELIDSLIKKSLLTKHKINDSGCILVVKSNGRVSAKGKNEYGECQVNKWLNIVAVSGGLAHSVGVSGDGKVFATGRLTDATQKVLSTKEKILFVASGDFDSFAVTYEGKVISGNAKYELSDWNDIVDLAIGREIVGDYHIVGLKSDGTVRTAGGNKYGQCNVENWNNIVSICAGKEHTVGLKSDGTVLAVGNNDYGQCNVEMWKNIIAIAAGDVVTIGIKIDGSICATEQTETYDWNNIVNVCASGYHAIGLQKDGTIVATSKNGEERNVSNVKLFTTIDTLNDELYVMKHIRELLEEQTLLEQEEWNLMGFFHKKKRTQLEAKLNNIKSEVEIYLEKSKKYGFSYADFD